MNRVKLYFLMIELTLLASAGSAIAQQEDPGIALAENLRYETGFERPVFMPGKLDGQGGWNNPSDTASILPVNPWEEKQSIRVAGNKLSDQGDLVGTRFGTFFLYDTEANQTPVVEVSVYAQLQGPSTDTGHGPEDDLISANLELLLAEFDENGELKPPIFIGGLLLSSSGHVWIIDDENRYVDGVQVDLDEYHSIRAQIDFDERVVNFWVDDNFVDAEVKFDATTKIFSTGALAMVAINDRNVVNPNKYKAYFDNYTVTAVVE